MKETGESSLTISMKQRLRGVAQHLISISTTCRQKKTFNLAKLYLFVKYLYSPSFFPLSPTFTGYFYGLSICLKEKKLSKYLIPLLLEIQNKESQNLSITRNCITQNRNPLSNISCYRVFLCVPEHRQKRHQSTPFKNGSVAASRLWSQEHPIIPILNLPTTSWTTRKRVSGCISREKKVFSVCYKDYIKSCGKGNLQGTSH